MKLSVIIPSYKDPLLTRTIGSLLDTSQLGQHLEVIAVLDGYWPPPTSIVDDPRVRYVHLGANRGMRGAINAGVAVARGEFLMRADEHCMFAHGFDRCMVDTFDNGQFRNCIMTARRFFLNPVKWDVMENHQPVDYEKLVIQGGVKFAGQRWRSRDKERKDYQVDTTMAMQGSCWVMPRQVWDEVVGELQTDGYGPLYQDSHEMVFKLWQAGGDLFLNKNTWFAHKHRSFSRTHNDGTVENPANKEAGWAYALEQWGDYYRKVVKPRWKI